MDSNGVEGIAGKVGDALSLVTKNIKYLREYHGRDLAVMTLVAQLTALRAPLGKIEEWTQSDLAATIPLHHQFVMDLEQTISSCDVLAESMDGYFSKLDLRNEGVSERNLRNRMVSHDKTCRGFQESIQRQTTAMGLLLNACNSKNTSEQKALLGKPANRAIFGRVRDDASTLIARHDTESAHTDVTKSGAASPKPSKIFPFDSEMTGSLVYQRALGFLSKESRSPRSTSRDVSRDRTSRKRQPEPSNSTDIFSSLKSGGAEVKCKIQVAILGDFGDATESFLRSLKLYHLATSPRKAEAYKDDILTALFNCIRTLLDNFKGQRPPCPLSAIDTFREETATIPPKMTTDLAAAISTIWYYFSHNSPSDLTSLLSRHSLPLYYLNNSPRLITPSYTPTPVDLAHLPSPPSIQHIKTRSLSGGHNYNFHHPSGHFRYAQAQSLHLQEFASVDALIFAIDGSAYNSSETDESIGMSPWEENETLFQAVIASPHVKGKPLILLFFNTAASRVGGGKGKEKASFKASEGGDDDDTVFERGGVSEDELRTRWRGLARGDKRDLIAHFVGVDEQGGGGGNEEGGEGGLELLRFVEGTVNEMIIWENIRNVVKTL